MAFSMNLLLIEFSVWIMLVGRKYFSLHSLCHGKTVNVFVGLKGYNAIIHTRTETFFFESGTRFATVIYKKA